MKEVLFLIFIFSFSVQLIYFLFIFSRILFYRENDKTEEKKGVSVVIAARNEKENLSKLIPLLLKQKYANFEIIIADDRSTDGTYELINSYQNKNLRSIRIDETSKGFNSKKYALTKAIELAQKEIILLTDADCLPQSDFWIRDMQSGFSGGKEIILGYSPYERKKGFLNLFIRYESFYTAIQYLSFALINQAYMGVGRNMAYLKKLFIENKGFEAHKAITGGDDDLFVGAVANRFNVAIRIGNESKVYSIPKTNYHDFVIQKTRHLAVGKQYSFLNKIKTGLLPFSQALLYFSFIFLIFMDTYISIILLIFILRSLLLIVTFALISRKLGETIKWLWFPILDLSYLINYTLTGLSAVFSKKIKWT